MMRRVYLSEVTNFTSMNVLVSFLISLPLFFLSLNRDLMLLGVVIILILLRLFYVKTLPPVILMSAFFQWLFYFAKLLVSLTENVAIADMEGYGATTERIILLGFISTAAFFIGIYWAVRRIPIMSMEEIRAFCMKIETRKLITVYVAIYAVLFLAGNLIWLFPGLSQPLYILTLFRWSIFFIVFVVVIIRDELKGQLLLLILLDVVVGFFSFFSHFKEVIYFSFIAYWIFAFRTSLRNILVTTVIVIITFILGLFWTAIKKDYRNFLNRGTGSQVVLTTRTESYYRLIDLISEVDGKRLSGSFDELVERLSWIGAFDAVYRRVPAKIPHEEGALWLAGLTRPFMPRLLFPEKKALEDSKELNKYSALHVEEKNTSISLSMVAGSYVDFGEMWMHLPMLLFGVCTGWAYKKAIAWGKYPLMGYALTMPMIYLTQINEQSINRMISSVVLYLLVLWFVQRFLLDEFIALIMVKKENELLK